MYILVRVHDIMKRDSDKDPATNPQASLAKVLIDQVVAIMVSAFVFNFYISLPTHVFKVFKAFRLIENWSSRQ